MSYRPFWGGRSLSISLRGTKRIEAVVDPRLCQPTYGGTRCPQAKESVMQYLLLIYENEAEKTPKESGKASMMAEYREFTDSIAKSKHMLGGNALQQTTTATTVRVRDGKTLSTDGPFAETREQLGGYYLVEAKDLDEAIKIAARIPSARVGSIEVRPVMVYSA